MNIRKYKKDHFKEKTSTLVAIVEQDQFFAINDMRYWSKHETHPRLVDLSVFANGEDIRKSTGSWKGPFTGRPTLISDISPVIRELTEYAAPNTITQYIDSLRKWWRIFDQAESSGMARVNTVNDINDVHSQFAINNTMGNLPFTNFLRILNMTRRGRKMTPLYWQPPEKHRARRQLPPKWQTDAIRFELKHRWFDALHRWDTAHTLLAKTDIDRVDVNEETLIKNYKLFKEVSIATGNARPNVTQLYNGLTQAAFNATGYSMQLMLDGFYPSGSDVRNAFNLFLANTGWNPAVLLSLNAENLVQPHPKDASRYLIRGYKARGKSEHFIEGLLKSRGSPGGILQELITRTAPLRELLKQQLDYERLSYNNLRKEGSSQNLIDQKLFDIIKLEQGIRSPWLYVSPRKIGIQWLSKLSYLAGKDKIARTTFLEEVINSINLKTSARRLIPYITPSDFRDAFAANAYNASGGMVLYVMKKLGHKSPNTTQIYLNNTLLNEESRRLYGTFSNALWSEVVANGRVDPTIIAKISRDGEISNSQRKRLDDYRSLRRSRIGVGCKDPYNPPARIMPKKTNGNSMCTTHRCTLCIENAVIFPESIDGLAKRYAELNYIKENIAATAFVESNFSEEFQNTEIALGAFNSRDTEEYVALWKRRIAEGSHRVVDSDGEE